MHLIMKDSYSYKLSKKTIFNRANKKAKAADEYHHGIEGLRFVDWKVYDSKEEASLAIDKMDRGFYDQFAVPYKTSTRKNATINWLVKTEVHV